MGSGLWGRSVILTSSWRSWGPLEAAIKRPKQCDDFGAHLFDRHDDLPAVTRRAEPYADRTSLERHAFRAAGRRAAGGIPGGSLGVSLAGGRGDTLTALPACATGDCSFACCLQVKRAEANGDWGPSGDLKAPLPIRISRVKVSRYRASCDPSAGLTT